MMSFKHSCLEIMATTKSRNPGWIYDLSVNSLDLGSSVEWNFKDPYDTEYS